MKQILGILLFALSHSILVNGQSTLDSINLQVGDSLIIDIESVGCGFDKTIHEKKYIAFKDSNSIINFEVISYKRHAFTLGEFEGISRKARKLNRIFLEEKDVKLNTEIPFDSISLDELFLGWDEDILEDSVWTKLQNGEYKYTTLYFKINYVENVDTSYKISTRKFEDLKDICAYALASNSKVPGGGSFFRTQNITVLYSHRNNRELIGDNRFYDYSFSIESALTYK